MKSYNIIKFFIASGLMIGCTLMHAKDDKAVEDHDPARITKSLLMQHNFQAANSHLDELTGNLQYIGQIINRCSIQFQNKQRIRLWILKHLELIKKIKHSSDEASQEGALLTIIGSTRVLLIHIIHALQKNFKELSPVTLPLIDLRAYTQPLSSEAEVEFHEKVTTSLSENTQLLQAMKDHTQTIGLTTVNIWARNIDAFNDTYKITARIGTLSRFAGLAGLAIYLMPYKWFIDSPLHNVPLLARVKRLIGTPESWDKEGRHQIDYYECPNAPQYTVPVGPRPNKNLESLWRSPDRRYMKDLFQFSLLMLSQQNVFGDEFNKVKSWARGYWNKLKGFNLPKMGTYVHPKITLDDKKLIGLESQVSQMKKVVQYIVEPEMYDRAAIGLEKGILLDGPSRTGKTLLANALCGSLNEELQKRGKSGKFAFKQIKWSEIRWTSDGIKNIIEEAKQNAPCVLFIDELHNLPLQTKEHGEVLTQFLTMSEALESTGVGDSVILLAATNRAYLLDDALLKPGRFGLQIHFEHPLFENRKKFFVVMCEENTLDPKEFDSDSLVRQTQKCSYGDLDLIFKNARFAARNQGRTVQQEDFEHAIYQQVYRLRYDHELPLTAQSRSIIAAHQAGHAFMYLQFENLLNEHLELVTIRGKWRKIQEKRFFDPKAADVHKQAKTKYGHIFTSCHSEAVDIGVDPLIKAKLLLAGSIAEKLLLGSTTYAYHPHDKRKALKELDRWAFNGLSQEDYTNKELIEPKKRAKEQLALCEKEVTEMLLGSLEALKELAQKLDEKTLLSYSEVKGILS